MAITSVTSFIGVLGQLELLEPGQLNELAADPVYRSAGLKDLARELIRRGWLTAFQVNQITQGRGADLVLGPYLLLERLGHGGMGQVYKARHRRLDRLVALKILRRELLANPESFRRFAREIRAAAQLSHPNIVLAYDADRKGDTHYFAMEYVEGTDLSRLIKHAGPLPVAQACDYVRQAALGLQHAHEHGLIHRDIKPSNLVLTADGRQIKILDLGLARLTDPEAGEDAGSNLTHTGQIMGTPDYIAPEQIADSHKADIRSDLYSLGCTFYFLLTSRAPFAGGNVLDKLAKHQWNEPQPVEELRRHVPPGVLVVLRKLMAKRPEDRYQTPAELVPALSSATVTSAPSAERGGGEGGAGGVRAAPAAAQGSGSPPPAASVLSPEARTTGGRPDLTGAAPAFPAPAGDEITPPAGVRSASETDIPWPTLMAVPSASGPRPRPARRERPWLLPAVAAGTGLFILACAALVAFLLVQKPGPGAPEKAAVGHRVAAHTERAPAHPAEDRPRRAPAAAEAEPPLQPALPPVLHVQVEANKTWQDTHVNVEAGKRVVFQAKGVWKKQGQAECGPDGLPSARRHRAVWPEAPAMCLLARIGSDPDVVPLAASATLEPRRSGRLFVRPNDFDVGQNSGTLELDVLEGGTHRFADAPAPEPTRVERAEAAVNLLAATAADRNVDRERLREEVFAFRLRFAGTPQAVRAAEILFGLPSPLDHLLPAQIPSREDFSWRPRDLVAVLGEHRWWHGAALRCLALSPDGKILATGGDDGVIRLWDVARGREVTPGKGRPARAVLKGHTGIVSGLAFSPDGKALVSGGGDRDDTVRVWNVASGKERYPPLKHVNHVYCVAVSSDGRWLAAGCAQRVVKVWELTTGYEAQSFEAHTGIVYAVAFSPAGPLLATAGDDRTVKVWGILAQKKILVNGQLVTPATVAKRPPSLDGHTDRVLAIAFSPDGKLLATGSGDRAAKVWQLATGMQQITLPGHASEVGCVAFVAAGQMLATGCLDGTVKFWDLATGLARATLPAHATAVAALAVRGNLLVTGGVDGTVRLWESAGPNDWVPRPGQRISCSAVALSPDARTLAAASLDNTVTLWDVVLRKERHTLKGHTAGVTSVAFSDDGKTLATGSEDGTVRLWDPAGGEERGTLPAHATGVTAVAFAPGGKTLASAGKDRLVKLWDVAPAPQPRRTLTGHTQAVNSVAFAPGGKLLASGGDDGTVRLWDAETGQSPATLPAQAVVRCVAFSPDGAVVASAGRSDESVQLWSVESKGKIATQNRSRQDSPVVGLAFAPDGKEYVAASASGQVGVWDSGPGQPERSQWGCQLVGAVTGVAYSADGRYIATANASGTVYLFRLAPPPASGPASSRIPDVNRSRRVVRLLRAVNRLIPSGS